MKEPRALRGTEVEEKPRSEMRATAGAAASASGVTATGLGTQRPEPRFVRRVFGIDLSCDESTAALLGRVKPRCAVSGTGAPPCDVCWEVCCEVTVWDACASLAAASTEHEASATVGCAAGAAAVLAAARRSAVLRRAVAMASVPTSSGSCESEKARERGSERDRFRCRFCPAAEKSMLY